MSNLISVHDLAALIAANSPQLVIVDTRFDLKNPGAGQEAYDQGHLPQSCFMDLDQDLSGPVQAHGGRHPLPIVEDFVARLEQKGISNDSHVVAYDTGSGMFAGRLWWMLRYLGHEKVQLLDGGLEAWQAAGFELTTAAHQGKRGHFKANVQEQMLVTVEDVKASLGREGVVMVDARAAERFRGDVEPLDKKAGHIPGAINIPFSENLRDKRFKSPEELAALYASAQDKDDIIAYCGSGVSANHNILAMEEAGLRDIKLYVGSWSDWSSHDENPIATGEEG